MANVTHTEGYINDIAFQLSGPTELVEAIKNYIRNLTKMHGGKHKLTHNESIVTSQTKR
jgi:hypothetical protein